MNTVKWDEIKIRCSGLGKIMSESRDNPPITQVQLARILELEEKSIRTPKQTEELATLLQKQINSQKVTLSDTCTTYLLEVYAWEKYGKESTSGDRKGRQVEKGKISEDDSITLLSLIDKRMYVKNTQRVFNDFLSGEPDLGDNPDIMKSKLIIDIKSNWDLINFLNTINRPLDKGYEKQLSGYKAITGADEAIVAYCLVDCPQMLINDEERRLLYAMGSATEESPEYLKKAAKLRNNLTFSEIPQSLRVNKIPVPKIDMNPIYERVEHCRKWLKNFEEIHENMNK